MGSRMSIVSRKKATVLNFVQSLVSIDFSCTVSKILVILNVLAHGKSYENGFAKKMRRS
ncbi:hypothetical protein BHM03_00012469 [Ensete ventricosum]|nr:hypothetical protein BHM03_00012469 [Ensete ventricosum]